MLCVGERGGCVGILIFRKRIVKIYFGLKPEQGICLDVTSKRDCLSSAKPLHTRAVVYQTIVHTHTGMPR